MSSSWRIDESRRGERYEKATGPAYYHPEYKLVLGRSASPKWFLPINHVVASRNVPVVSIPGHRNSLNTNRFASQLRTGACRDVLVQKQYSQFAFNHRKNNDVVLHNLPAIDKNKPWSSPGCARSERDYHSEISTPTKRPGTDPGMYSKRSAAQVLRSSDELMATSNHCWPDGEPVNSGGKMSTQPGVLIRRRPALTCDQRITTNQNEGQSLLMCTSEFKSRQSVQGFGNEVMSVSRLPETVEVSKRAWDDL